MVHDDIGLIFFDIGTRRIIAAADEFSISTFAIDEWFSADRTNFSFYDLRLNFFHIFFRRFKVFLEFFPESREKFHTIDGSICDGIEIVLHSGGIRYIHILGEIFVESIHRQFSLFGRNEDSLFGFYIVSIQ